MDFFEEIDTEFDIDELMCEIPDASKHFDEAYKPQPKCLQCPKTLQSLDKFNEKRKKSLVKAWKRNHGKKGKFLES